MWYNIITKEQEKKQINQKKEETTMKTTKNINATYNTFTGAWAIRDNGEVLAEGQGIKAYAEAFAAVKAIATKKIVEKWKN